MTTRARIAVLAAAVAALALGLLLATGVVRAPWGLGSASHDAAPPGAAPGPSAVAGLHGREGGAASSSGAVPSAEPAPAPEAGTAPAAAAPAAPLASLRGRVVRMPGAKPVPRARVRLLRLLAEDGGDWSALPGDALLPRDVEAAGDGAFSFRGLEPGTYRLVARDAAGGAPAEARVRLLGRDDRALSDLEIEDGGALAGRVLGADGAPRGGVRVAAAVPSDYGAPVPGLFVVTDPRGPLDAAAEAVSAADGTWLLVGVPAGSVSLLALAASGEIAVLQPLTVEAGRRATGIDLVLAAGRDLEGTVRGADGRGAPGARVLAMGGKGDAIRTTETDVGGRFRLVGLVQGEAFVVAMDAARRAHGLVEVAADAKEVDVRLHAVGSLTGRVVDAATERPVPGPIVGAVPDPERGQMFPEEIFVALLLVAVREVPWRPVAVETPGGAFRLDGVAAGRSQVRVTAAGYVPALVQVVVPADGTVDLGTVRLAAGRTASGVVVDAKGLPLAGATIELARVADPGAEAPTERVEPGEILADALGRFETPPLAPGRYSLSVVAEGSLRTAVDVDLLSASVRDLVVALDGATELRVRVVDSDGRPAEGVPLWLIGPGSSDSRRSGSDGVVDHRAGRAGRWAVAWDSVRFRTVAWPPPDGAAKVEAPPAAAQVTVAEHGRTEVTLRLPRLATLRGRVRVGGKPLAGATIRLAGTATMPPAELEATTDATGAFTFRHVEPAEYRVHVASYADREGVHPVDVRVPDATEREIEIALPEAPAPTPEAPGANKCG